MRLQTWFSISLVMIIFLSACGGGRTTETQTNISPPLETNSTTNTPSDTNATANTNAKIPWTRYVGAHYTQIPNSGLIRSWAGGGLRDPGGSNTNYRPVFTGGGYVDDGYTAFSTLALPELQSLLGQGQYSVVTVGGNTPSSASVFLDSMATPAGRETYRLAIQNRVDAIASLGIANWQSHINFQFGNEITNSNSTGFYGATCLWVTRNDLVPTTSCDMATQFTPTYVEYYLAPGIAALEEKSLSLFGRSNILQGMLGSIVNLSNREEFLSTLLNYRVVGTYAPAYAGRTVSDLVDSVSIHYTAVTPEWRTSLDNFSATYWPDGAPITRIRALWATEEGGAKSASEGYGMATAMRVLARYLSWWQANGLTPDTGHVFFWGSDIKGSQGSCPACTSLDEDMPLLYNFTADSSLMEITKKKSLFGVTGSFESYEFAVEGQDKRVLIGFDPVPNSNSTVTSLTLDLSTWAGRRVSLIGYHLNNRAPSELAITPVDVSASASTTVNFSTTLSDNDALLILVQAL